MYWAADIQELNKMFTKLENWHDLSLHSIINSNWSLVQQNSQLLQMMEQMAKSKICVSIWKALIHEQESKWNMTQLRNMTVDEVANWIRSMHREFNIATPDFNLETFVQVVYNKKLDGRHIR
eukprot:189880_1